MCGDTKGTDSVPTLFPPEATPLLPPDQLSYLRQRRSSWSRWRVGGAGLTGSFAALGFNRDRSPASESPRRRDLDHALHTNHFPAIGAFPSVKERAAAGKAAREKAPRSSHGKWEPAARRRIRSSCSRSRRRAEYPSSSRFATGGCSPRPSPSTAGRRRSWRWTWPRPRTPVCVRRSAATPTSRTSASSPRPTAAW